MIRRNSICLIVLCLLILTGVSPGVAAVTVSQDQSPYSINARDSFINCSDLAGNVALNLPAATGSGRRLTIEKISMARHICQVVPNGTDLIDGLTGAFGDPVYYVLAFSMQTLVLVDRARGAWARFSDYNDAEDSYTLGNGITNGQDIDVPADVEKQIINIGQWVPAPGLYDARADASIDITFGRTVPSAISFRFMFVPRHGTGPIVTYKVNSALLAQAVPFSTIQISFAIGSNGNDGSTGEVLVTTLVGTNAGFRVYCTALGGDITLGASSHFLNSMSYGGGAGGIVPPS